MLSKMLSRTWLLRMGVAAVFVVLVGAWAVGVTNGGDTPSPKEEAGVPAPSDTATDAEAEPSDVAATTEVEPVDATTSADPLDESTPDAVEEAPGDEPVPVVNQNPTPKPSVQTPKPSTKPKPTPTPTPTQPAAECTDLLGVVDCVLAPITTRP